MVRNYFWRVKWRVIATGVEGHGDWLDSEEVAKKIVIEQNEKWPGIEHWIERR